MEHLRSQFKSIVQQLEDEVHKVQDDRARLNQEIEHLEKEYDSLNVAPYKLKGYRILLDVGGHHFSTTLETLTAVPDSAIGRMFSGRFPVKLTHEGLVFIDRDGTHFRHILNFLRDSETWKNSLKNRQLVELKAEARYYGLEESMFGNSKTPTELRWLDSKARIGSFSSQYYSCPASNVLDPTASYWLSESGQTTNQWLVFEFDKEVFVNKIGITSYSFECSLKDFVVQLPDGSGGWEDIMEFQAVSGLINTTEQCFEGFEVSSQQIRIFFRNNWGSGGGPYILVQLVRFYGAELD